MTDSMHVSQEVLSRIAAGGLNSPVAMETSQITLNRLSHTTPSHMMSVEGLGGGAGNTSISEHAMLADEFARRLTTSELPCAWVQNYRVSNDAKHGFEDTVRGVCASLATGHCTVEVSRECVGFEFGQSPSEWQPGYFSNSTSYVLRTVWASADVCRRHMEHNGGSGGGVFGPMQRYAHYLVSSQVYTVLLSGSR